MPREHIGRPSNALGAASRGGQDGKSEGKRRRRPGGDAEADRRGPAASGGAAGHGKRGASVGAGKRGAPVREGKRGAPVREGKRGAPVREGMRGGPAEAAGRQGGSRQMAWLALAGLAVVLFYSSARLAAPAPWSYDEYYHLGMARELWAHFPLRSFPWTPFSLISEHFADGVPLFHLALMPFAGWPIERAGLAGVLLGQAFVLTCLGVALWRLRARQAWIYMLGMATLGSLFALRFDMCRPQLLLGGFSLLFLGLLVTGARPWALAAVAAVFGLAHAGGWIAIFYTAVWAAAGWLMPAAAAGALGTSNAPGGAGAPGSTRAAAPGPEGEASGPAGGGRRLLWRPVVWVAAGWLAGQLIHPNFPYNLRLMALANLVVPFEASPAGNAALRSQIGEELAPPGLAILAEQWTIFLAPAVTAVTLLRERRLRTRATLTTALVAVAFLLLGALLLRRMLEVGAPLALLALAALAVERRRQGLGGLLGGWTAWAAAGALLVGTLWTATTVRRYGFGEVSAPQEMARWLGEHGRPGERVFTAQWADSAPLFYSAPRLQSLVALDPTLFFAKDPRLFQEYVDVVQGRRPQAARIIRQRFGARWVTIWQAPVYEKFAEQLVATPGVQLVYRDAYYVIADLAGVK
jgi:hypothetical protein